MRLIKIELIKITFGNLEDLGEGIYPSSQLSDINLMNNLDSI